MDNKYKKGLVQEIKEEKAYEKEQIDLKEKYNLNVESDVVVVEKSNAYKFTITMLIRLLKLIASLCLLTLATIGLLTLIYPESRDAFVNTMNEIYYQLSVYLPFLQ